MSNDHVTIPKCIQRRFTISGKKHCCYCLFINKPNDIKQRNINKLGTMKDYYDHIEVELKLSRDYENKISIFLDEYNQTVSYSEKETLINHNYQLIQDFFSISFARTKYVFNEAIKLNNNIESHSEILKVQFQKKYNYLEMLKGEYNVFPVINKSSLKFINNSVGIGFISEQNEPVSFFIPTSPIDGILIIKNNYSIEKSQLIINALNIQYANLFNMSIVSVELIVGGWYIFGNSEELLKKYMSYFSKNLV